ncbi:hypothetical protein BT528P2_00043 [Bacteroides phage BT528P2]|nr:hypothetical protein BT498P1_00010 [Bacteroides phage BT498P1]WAX09334.1 hypothetical protein BT528P1_00043 [Bacteroides phage BT528P1]WAX09380.1 hypothetical protein BT528P2_00043 [Bacteroides phage BT528P2]
MKIEISIDSNSKVYELKALSLFAESLATGKHREETENAPIPESPNQKETGKVVMLGKGVSESANETAKAEVAGEGPTQQSKIEALADKVAEATQVKEEPEEPEEYTVEAVISMTEDEMKNVSTPILIEALETFGIDPTTRPGKNTNAKLRGLLMSAIAEADKEDEAAEKAEETEKAGDIKPQEDPDVPTVEAQDESTVENAPEEEEITIDMLRNVARKLIAANKRKEIAEAFEACGCSNFSTLKKQDYAKFYELCQK